MPLIPLFDPSQRPMRVAGFMSGKGTNLEKILANQESFEILGIPPYTVVAIFFDRPEGSRALELGKRFNIPAFYRDLKSFYTAAGKPLKDMETRAQFDHEMMDLLVPFDIHAIALAGYMSLVSEDLSKRYLVVNVHPADLSIRNWEGLPRFRGKYAVREAILDGQPEIRASTHLVEGDAAHVDCGRVLMRSTPLPVEIPKDRDNFSRYDAYQDGLKRIGDWQIFPRTLELIAWGRYHQDEKGLLHLDGKPIPDGVSFDDTDMFK